MHLLNNPSASPEPGSSYYPPTDLPPIQSFSSFAKASNISLPPLEPDAASSHGHGHSHSHSHSHTHSHGQSHSHSNSHGHHEKSASKAAVAHHIPPLSSITEDYNSGRYSHDTSASNSLSYRQHNGGISLRMLFDNPDVNESSHSLNHILDDVPEPQAASSTPDDVSNKKRHRAMTVKDDIMHLPQPLKKQKSCQNIMPPIISGLYEPPPNAAVFPPIALDDNATEPVAPVVSNTLKDFMNHNNSSTTHIDTPELRERSSQADLRQDNNVPTPGTPEAEKPMARVKRKAAKPRKKWSEEETRHLLLGVNKYGVGKWTSILEDPEYRFNGRTAGDLKDRFRTCCPDELRVVPSKSRESLRSQDKPASTSPVDGRPKGKSKGALLLEDLLAADDETPSYTAREESASTSTPNLAKVTPSQQDSDGTAKPKKSRAHRKKLEDLQAMGIHGPFKKSHRRERRPFTQTDDDQILEGLNLYGPAWTKIQRDPRFDLSSRQPTDLRDRVRNKYPEVYKQIEEKQAHGKEPVAMTASTTSASTSAPSSSTAPANAPVPSFPPRTLPVRSGNVLEPSVSNLINENSLMTLEPHLRRAGSREDMMLPKWASSLPASSAPAATTTSGSFHELPGMDAFTRDALEGDVGDVGETGEPPSSATFIGMMDISRLLLDG